MGVADAGRRAYPFLAPEIALLRELVARDAPVLGICLGSQLLAAARGRARLPEHAPRARRHAGAGARGRLGPGRFHRTPTPSRRWPAWPRAAAGPALARRHVRPAARARCTWRRRRSAAHRPSGSAGGSSACSFTASSSAETIAVWVREDADYVRGALGPEGGARILADTDRLLRRRAADLGSAARQHHLGHAIVGVHVVTVGPQPDFKVGARADALLDRSRRQPRRARVARIARRPARGAQWSACPSCSARSTSARREDHAQLRPGRADPGPDDRGAGRRSRARRGVVDRRRRSSSGARPGVYHNTAVVIDADGKLAGPLPQDAHPRRSALSTRSSTSRPATSASARSTPRCGRIGTLVCWDQWYPEAARLTALRGRRRALLPDGDRLAPAREGRVRRRAGATPGRPIQRAHAIANGVYVAAVNRVGHEAGRRGGAASSSGAASFVADPFGVDPRRGVARPRRRSLIVDVRSRGTRRRSAATGRSCATAASTPTAPITRRFLDE